MDIRLGVSSGFFREPSVEKWQAAMTAGISDVELGLIQDLPLKDILEYGQAQYQLLRNGGMRVSSVHLPFGDRWDISALDEPRRQRALSNHKALLDWAAQKHIDIAVLHASYEPIPEADRTARLSQACEAIGMLGDHARTLGIRLAVENLPRTCLGNCADEMLRLCGYGHSAYLCFDVNHLLIEPHGAFYKAVAPHVITTHLSDYDRVDERHWLVGDGCIDWKELIGLFESHGYDGRYVFELNEDASPRLQRTFSPAELAQRFRQITGNT